MVPKRHIDGFLNRARLRLERDPIVAKSLAVQSYERLLGFVDARPFENPRFESEVHNIAGLLAEAAAVRRLELDAPEGAEHYLGLALGHAEHRVESERSDLDGLGLFYLAVALRSLAGYRIKLAVLRAPEYEVPLYDRETRLEVIVEDPGAVTVSAPDAESLVDADLDLDEARRELEAYFRVAQPSGRKRARRFEARIDLTRTAIEAYLGR